MDADANVVLTVASFFDVSASHVHHARVHESDGRLVELLFTDGARSHAIGRAGGGASPVASRGSFLDYAWLGVERTWLGVDHVAFLLALLILCARLRDVAFAVVGFSLGHSLTLSLAALGLVAPAPPVVEAMIALTVVLVAVENVALVCGGSRSMACVAGLVLAALAVAGAVAGVGLPPATLVGLALFAACYLLLVGSRAQAARLRPAVSVPFGLVHGFGFAAALAGVGLPPGQPVLALLGFNAGVEVGQIVIVLVLWSAGRMLAARLARPRRRLAFELASAALCAAGTFWFVGRACAGW